MSLGALPAPAHLKKPFLRCQTATLNEAQGLVVSTLALKLLRL